jgi:alkaline phosphatase
VQSPRLASACCSRLSRHRLPHRRSYPLNRAQILVGADFDLKVEFPGAPESADVKVTIDGEDAGQALGKAPEIIANEDDLPQIAYWIRGARLATAGRHTVEARAGSAKASVAWDAFATPEGRKAKNVILFIGDGLSMAHRTAARILSKGIAEGRYGGELAIDNMPYMALVSTAGTDSVITNSANSMTAYTTGHKSCVNALGVHCAKNLRALAHPKVETIAELAKRKLDLAVGVVTNTEIEDATPAGMVAHTACAPITTTSCACSTRISPRSSWEAEPLRFCPSAETR